MIHIHHQSKIVIFLLLATPILLVHIPSKSADAAPYPPHKSVAIPDAAPYPLSFYRIDAAPPTPLRVAPSSPSSDENMGEEKKPISPKKVPCKICKKTFAVYRAMCAHITNDHPEYLRVSCPLCPKKFLNEQGLGTHIGKMHDISKKKQKKEKNRRDNYDD